VARASAIVKFLGLGYVWVAAAVVVIAAIRIALEDGFRRMLQLFSPFNDANFFGILLVMAPGLALLWWAENLAEKGK
jgi:hypothetical protein